MPHNHNHNQLFLSSILSKGPCSIVVAAGGGDGGGGGDDATAAATGADGAAAVVALLSLVWEHERGVQLERIVLRLLAALLQLLHDTSRHRLRRQP